MTLPTHRLSRAALSALAGGTTSEAAVDSLVFGRRSRDLIVLRAMVDAATEVRHPEAALAATSLAWLAAAERTAPAAVTTVLHYPAVASWALTTLRRLRAGDHVAATPGWLAAVAAAAAVRGTLRADLELTCGEQGTVRLPSLGTAQIDGAGCADGVVRLRCGPAGAELLAGAERIPVPADPHRVHGRWAGLPLLSVTGVGGRRLQLLMDVLEDREDGSEFAVGDLRSEPVVRAWHGRLTDAWQIMTRGHTALAAEIRSLITVLAPLWVRSGSASATPNDAFGCVALSLPSDGTSFALTLAHEVQHVKLTALLDLLSLVDLDSTQLFYAPWRDDPRPAVGLLHGVYAHLGVAGFWLRQLRRPAHGGTGEFVDGLADRRHAEIEFARWRAAAHDTGQALLVSGLLTRNGRYFVSGMLDVLRSWTVHPVSSQSAAVAAELNARHRATWLAGYGGRH